MKGKHGEIMTREEKIQLYELLRKFEDELRVEVECLRNSETKRDFAALISTQNLVTSVCEMQMLLCYDF